MLSLASVTPDSGPLSGNTLVTLVGTGFNSTTQVTFDTLLATEVEAALDGLSLTARTPAHGLGTVDVSVGNLDDMTAALLASSYTYVSGPWQVQSLDLKARVEERA